MRNYGIVHCKGIVPRYPKNLFNTQLGKMIQQIINYSGFANKVLRFKPLVGLWYSTHNLLNYLYILNKIYIYTDMSTSLINFII